MLLLRFRRPLGLPLMALASCILFARCGSSAPEPAANSAFIGSYQGSIQAKGTSSGGSYDYTINQVTVVVKAGSNPDELSWTIQTPLGSTDAWKATSRGNQLTIPRQTGTDLTGDPAIYEGTGTLTGQQLNMTIEAKDPARPASTNTYIISGSK